MVVSVEVACVGDDSAAEFIDSLDMFHSKRRHDIPSDIQIQNSKSVKSSTPFWNHPQLSPGNPTSAPRPLSPLGRAFLLISAAASASSFAAAAAVVAAAACATAASVAGSTPSPAAPSAGAEPA